MKQIIFTSLLTLTVFLLKAQPGTPDSSFGTNGIVITENFTAMGYCVLIQPDGKILVGGNGGQVIISLHGTTQMAHWMKALGMAEKPQTTLGKILQPKLFLR